MVPSDAISLLRQTAEARLADELVFLRAMVAINSHTENREGVHAVGEVTAAGFADLGFTASRSPSADPRYGEHLFLVREGSGGPAFAFVSHLDTVFTAAEEEDENFAWSEEGDRIYGPGTVDIKGGTMMMRLVLELLRTWQPDLFAACTWYLCFNAAEEVLLPDFAEQSFTRLPPDTRAALVFEGGEGDGTTVGLVDRRKGRANARLTARGRSAHAGGQHAYGANAIRALARAIEACEALTDLDRELTVNVGLVHGGTGINRVPQEAWALLETRCHDADLLAATVERIEALAGATTVQAQADGYPVILDIEVFNRSAPLPATPSSAILAEAFRTAAEQLGIGFSTEARGGLSDANFFASRFPTIDGLGPSGGNAHCSERSADGRKMPEFLLVPAIVPKAVLNTMAIADLAARPGALVSG